MLLYNIPKILNLMLHAWWFFCRYPCGFVITIWFYPAPKGELRGESLPRRINISLWITQILTYLDKIYIFCKKLHISGRIFRKAHVKYFITLPSDFLFLAAIYHNSGPTFVFSQKFSTQRSWSNLPGSRIKIWMMKRLVVAFIGHIHPWCNGSLGPPGRPGPGWFLVNSRQFDPQIFDFFVF